MITTSYLAETLSTYLNVEKAVFAVESIFYGPNCLERCYIKYDHLSFGGPSPLHILCFFLGSFCLAGTPLRVWRVMDQGGEFPITQDNSGKRPGSPLISSSRPLWKRRHLEDNRNTAETHIHLSESPQRPQGGRDIFLANKEILT